MIFTGNGYSAEWPVEANKRGLPNLNTTPKAVATWNSDKNKYLGDKFRFFLSSKNTDSIHRVFLKQTYAVFVWGVGRMRTMRMTCFLNVAVGKIIMEV